MSSIYDLYSTEKKKQMLYVGAAVALLAPFTETTYLPALSSIRNSLSTSDSAVALTVSLYLAAVGFGQVLFGPLTDKFGRLKIIFGCLSMYEVLVIASIFAPTIEWLTALRILLGLCISGTMVSSQSIITDIYEEKERGAAMGIYFVPILLGPVIAPLCGGILSETFTWRSTFVLLAIMAIPIFLATALIVPETEHWHVAQRLKKLAVADEEAVIPVDEIEQPTLLMPWESLYLLFDYKLTMYYLLGGSTFASMFTSLTILPLYLTIDPYNLSAGIVGTTYLPIGVAMLIGSLVG